MVKQRYYNYVNSKFEAEPGSIKAIRLKYGIEMFYLSFSKLIAVLVVSILLGTFWETVITLVSYNFIRQKSQGLHAKSSLKCLISSMTFFVILPWMVVHVDIYPYISMAAAMAIPVIAYLYAPSDTQKKPIVQKKVRERLKKDAIVRSFIIVGLTLIVPSATVKFLLVMGAYIALLYVLPITYKIMKEERNNYEKFERNA
ncbi:accessory gene regulator B family protein [Fusibacter bizertensis]